MRFIAYSYVIMDTHHRCCFKLKRYGIKDPLLSWFKSYLSNRVQQVRVGKTLSDAINVTSGVPQGGVLAPLLFKIHINDLPLLLEHHSLDVRVSMFADDMKLSRIITTLDDAAILQKAIDKTFEWCNNNAMSLNINKCKVISFKRRKVLIETEYNIDNQSLMKVDHIRDLGVILDSKLNFKKHIDKIVTSGK